jgi:hypothetical protein
MSEAGGVLDGLLHLHEEGDGLPAVDEAVVVAEGEVHHRADDDLAVDGDGALVDGVQAEDGALRRLMIGVESIEPKMPPLVMVKTPPSRSARVILPSRAFLAASAMAFSMPAMPSGRSRG